MGNNLSNGNVQLGESASVHHGGREVERVWDGEIMESWRISYKVGDRPVCAFSFSLIKGDAENRSLRPHGNDLIVITNVVGEFVYHVIVRRAESNLLRILSARVTGGPSSSTSPGERTCFAANAWGGIKETTFESYERGTVRGLIVWEWKKKSRDEENPYMGTVAHYYTEKEKDVGLSVVVKRIRASDGGSFDFVVDGPHQHPVDALLFLFDKVRRTGTWDPNHCPHCADSFIQRLRRMFSQSGSECSDVDDVFHAVPRYGRKHDASILANHGTIRGNHSGNLYIENFFATGR